MAHFNASVVFSHYFNEHGNKTHPAKSIVQAMRSRVGRGKFSPVPPVKVCQVQYPNQPFYLRLNNPNPRKPLRGEWMLNPELGAPANGKIKRDTIALPREMHYGYHQLHVCINHQVFECVVIVAPHCCYQPPALQAGKKLWGSFLQLYTLKSAHNWGIGDFGDLKDFIKELAPYQADFLGLNPIHALFPANPESASPYSPSSRRWLNIAYINVPAVPEFQQSKTAQAWFNQPDIQQKLADLRAQAQVNYAEVVPLKLTALRLAYDELAKNLPALPDDFAQFLRDGGESLQVQATFDALHAHRMANAAAQWSWTDWEAAYQRYDLPAVQQFRQEYADTVQFYAWLQFVADQQFAECHQAASAMTIGLYRDLAVGVAGGGAETWENPHLYSLNTAIGAPPDRLAPQGQNWGLVPMNPPELTAQAYQPFIALVRANMRHCGALRLDHIMSLLRLWWVVQGDSAKNGVYVRYPVDDLLAIIALESQRHQCVVIGEDLGIVPKAIVQKLKAAGVLSYKIFYFEFDESGSRPLADYPYQAMTTLSTHDLPTIHGYWAGNDFELGEQFGIYPSPQVLAALKRERADAKAKILQRLAEAGESVDGSAPNRPLVHALQRYVAGVNSALFGFQPEDWLVMTAPVNIPGTSTEYPNWRRKLSATVAEIFADADVQQLLRAVKTAREKH